MNKNFSNSSVTDNSLLYLEIIYSMQGKCTVSNLAKMLSASKPGITLKINELVEQGLVYKKQDEKDGRKFYLFVNEEKVPKYRVYREQDNLAIKRIKEKYSNEDISKFCDMLNIITTINYDTRENKDKNDKYDKSNIIG